MRKWLVALVILVLVLIGADFGLRFLADYWVGRELQSSLSLSDRPSVSIGGFPFIPELISGDVSSVAVTAKGSITQGKLPVHEVNLTLHDVSFSPRQLVAGGGTTIRAAMGEGTASFTQGDLNAALGASIPVTIRFRNGRVVVRTGQSGQEFVATPSVSGGQLVLTPNQASIPRVSIDLPEIVGGITYRKVRIKGETATLSFTLRKATFDIPG
jgi:hypothetical protein